MKSGVFVEGLSNVTRFLKGQRVVEERGAREAGWHLVKGEPGYGKTKTLMWYGVKKTPVIIRCKADYTPSWMLQDICAALGLQQSHRVKTMFDAIVSELMTKGCPALVIDEIDHAARNVKVLESLRDISDASECTVIAGGMKDAEALMKRFPQIYSRVAKVTTFGPATSADVATICESLSDTKLAPELVEEIRKITQGRLRLVMNAIARIESYARTHRGTFGIADLNKRALINSDDRAQPDAA